MIAASTSSLTLLGRSTVTALSPKATTPILIDLGCRSTKARAADFAASIRVGSRSLAFMLFETSNARITVPSRSGRATFMVGRARAKASSPSAATKKANGTWRRTRARRAAPVGTSPSEASRAARSARCRSAHQYATTSAGTTTRASSSHGEPRDISGSSAFAIRPCGRARKRDRPRSRPRRCRRRRGGWPRGALPPGARRPPAAGAGTRHRSSRP